MHVKPQSKHIAVIISYITTSLTALTSIILIPICLKYVGADQYGLYQKIYAVAQYLMIIDIGISTTVIRYSTAAREKNDTDLEMRLYGYMFRITAVINIIILAFGIGLYVFIDIIYNNMSVTEIAMARQLLAVMIFHSILTVFQDFFTGVINTYEQFIFSNSLKLFRMSFRLILIPVSIYFTKDILAIAIVDAVLMGITILASLFYNVFYLKTALRFSKIESTITKGVVALMLANLLQNVSKYLNNGIDKVLLGRLVGNTGVTTYSIAMTFISFYMVISTVIQSVHYPEVVQKNERGASLEELTDIVVRVGRTQLILCGGFLCGFYLLGKEFIQIWAGSGHDEAWYIALIIMVPLIIPLIQNVCLCILTAKDKRLFRAVVVVGLSVINVITSIFLIKKIGLLGAPIGTAVAYLIGNVIAMNMYYKFNIGIRVFSMLFRIFHKILPALIFTTIISAVFIYFIPSTSVLLWLCKAAVFMALYFAALWLVGFNKSEKQTIRFMITKVIHRRRNIHD